MIELLDQKLNSNGYEHMIAVNGAAAALLDRIETRQAVVAVIGLGYVGLPLAVAFAESGFHVVGIDIEKKRVASLNAGKSHISDIPSERIAPLIRPMKHISRWHNAANFNGHSTFSVTNGGGDGLDDESTRPQGSFSATTDYNILSDVDAIIICVPTPLSSTKDPDMSYIVSAVEEITHRLHEGMLIVLESTTYPGTTEELILPLLEKAQAQHRRGENGHSNGNGNGRSSLIVGRDFFLAFSPERIDPGRTDWTVHTTPKVIGGVTPLCLQIARSLYGSAIENVVPVSSPKAAEMVKLLENTFRAVNIGLINEVAIMCERLGVDVWEVIEAAKTKPFGYMPFYPGPGLGGHCIPIDPEYLAWKLKTLDYNARFIQLAAEINFGMPRYVLSKISDALNKNGKPLNSARILILGVAYKADVGDLRESPALDVIHLLLEKGAAVSYNDPYVPRLTLDGQTMTSVELSQKTLQKADCVVITTAHQSYDWSYVVENSRSVVDTRNATRTVSANSRKKIVRL